jgi:hypothetical protein
VQAIRALFIDPSLKNWGLVRAVIKLDTLQIGIERMRLVSTEAADKKTRKVVRRNSDDLRRAQDLTRAFREEAEGCHIGISEIPVGSQSSRAMCSYGVCIGILAGSSLPIIQVQPTETKLAAVGTKTASKEEMIEWGMATFPSAGWLMRKLKGAMVPIDANEHLADAIAAGKAGLGTDEFKRLMAFWRASTTVPIPGSQSSVAA